MATAGPPAHTSRDPHVRRVEWAAWATAAVLFALHSWLYRYEMVNLDGISYLELAWAWREGRWADAINGYWSPMYPWLLALFLGVIDPSPAAEYPTVHAANAAAGLIALGGFTYLVRGLESNELGTVRMPAPFRAAVAYALFIWAAIVMLVVWMESPDMLLATFIFLSAGALARIAQGDERLRHFALLGAGIGLGYLTKSAMLPIGGLFFLGAVAIAVRRRALTGIFLSGLIAVVLMLPWVLTVSRARGKLTLGETGRINYVWFVNGSENWPLEWPRHWPHWSGDPANGTPRHPARRLNEDPAVYEFAGPVAGTYPMWHDVSVWYDGIRTYFDPADQLRRLKISAQDLYAIFTRNPYNPDFFNPQPALLGLLLMTAGVMWGSGSARTFLRWWPGWTPAVGAIALYAAVYVEPRYVGAFVVLLWVFAVHALQSSSNSEAHRRVLKACGATMVGVLAVAVLIATGWETYGPLRRVLRGESDREHNAWLIATRMQQEGVKTGDPIAVAGSAQVATRWAYLARVRIVAEVPLSDSTKLWNDSAAREAATQALRRAGARWVMLEDRGVGTTLPDWRRVAGTPYFLKDLQ